MLNKIWNTFINEIKGFCKNDDTCLFIILALIGFLLCLFLNRSEGFLDYGPFDEKEESHNYGPSQDIGKKPEPLGIQPGHNKPKNGYGPLESRVNLARQGKQYQVRQFNQGGKLHRSEVGLPIGYDWGKSGGYYFMEGKPSDFGLGKPMQVKEQVMPSKVQGVVSSSPDESLSESGSVTSSSDNTLSLVLFYAPWCGHSKNMLDDYDSVISLHDGKELNGVTLKIIKIDMDSNKNAAKEYGVEVRGFPTLYTFTNVNGKQVGQVFNFRKKDEIIAELDKRTKSMN